MLPALGEEVAWLATAAKYLPEDERPGLLTLALVGRASATIDAGRPLGSVATMLEGLKATHISIPALVALGWIGLVT